jgi:hypothetical protein
VVKSHAIPRNALSSSERYLSYRSHTPMSTSYIAATSQPSTSTQASGFNHTTSTSTMASPPPPKSKFTELLDTTSASSYISALNVSLEDILAETEARRRSSSTSDSNQRSGTNSPTSPTSPISTTSSTATETTAKGRLRRISIMGKHR